MTYIILSTLGVSGVRGPEDLDLGSGKLISYFKIHSLITYEVHKNIQIFRVVRTRGCEMEQGTPQSLRTS